MTRPPRVVYRGLHVERIAWLVETEFMVVHYQLMVKREVAPIPGLAALTDSRWEGPHYMDIVPAHPSVKLGTSLQQVCDVISRPHEQVALRPMLFIQEVVGQAAQGGGQ